MTIDTTLLNDVLNKAGKLLDQLKLVQNPTKHSIPDMDFAALRWDKNHGFIPIKWKSPLSRDKLLHVDRQAKLLLANTQQFIEGFPANNALLWGARGTGKSSLIQAVLGSFAKEQLKIIEINNHSFADWAYITEAIDARPKYKFIIFCDDLSFNSNDANYREVKAALDGSLISLPTNALIYASSNRRHLLPEKLSDNLDAQHIDGEVHHSEAIEETISLSDRFGLWLSFHSLTQNQYIDIVNHWISEYGLEQDEDNYRELALRWALERGSRSGRIANQFARNYAGQFLLNKKTI